MAAASFTMHTYLMREARSLEELEQIVEIKQLKQPFTEGIRHLRELSEKAQVADAAQELPNYIKGLETLYADTLDKNAAILQSVQNSLRLERDIKRQVATMNELGSELHENAGIFSEKVNAIQEQVAVKGQTQASSETPEDGGQGAEGGEQDNSQPHNDLRQITRVQKISSDLRLDIAFMTNYGRQMLMAGEEEKISSIKTDKIAQTAKRIESSLGTLASFSYEEDMGSAELKTILQKMETDFVLLRSVLTDGKQSLAVLRSQWLGEQKSLSLRNNALKETADSLGVKYSPNIGPNALQKKIDAMEQIEAEKKALTAEPKAAPKVSTKPRKVSDKDLSIMKAKNLKKVKIVNMDPQNRAATTVFSGVCNMVMDIQRVVPLNMTIALEE
ncbi:MAG TPA: hypothetical protein ENK58_04440, partial [Desulfobacterales bacterium]|nr:hypothetical protein [Desulfobacterales bacterium]